MQRDVRGRSIHRIVLYTIDDLDPRTNVLFDLFVETGDGSVHRLDAVQENLKFVASTNTDGMAMTVRRRRELTSRCAAVDSSRTISVGNDERVVRLIPTRHRDAAEQSTNRS